MLLPDVNVLVYAVRPDSEEHERYRAWLDSMVNGDSAFGCSDHVLGGFLRVVTHTRVFARPDRLGDALAFADAVRARPNLAAPTWRRSPSSRGAPG